MNRGKQTKRLHILSECIDIKFKTLNFQGGNLSTYMTIINNVNLYFSYRASYRK